MSKKKKMILLVILALVIAAIGTGIYFYRDSHSKAYVQPIEEMNCTWVVEQDSNQGQISDAASQNVYLSENETVQEVYVKKGDTVEKGDKLFSYDTEGLSLEVDAKKLAVESAQSSLSLAKQQLQAYQAITVVPDAGAVPVVEPEQTEPTDEEQQDIDTSDGDETDQVPQGYTQAQKDKMISDQTIKIKSLETEIKLAQNALEQAKLKLSDATVTATVPGIVKTVGDPDSVPNDGSPFLSIVSQQGIALTGYINEMDYNDVKVGDKVKVSSYETGNETTATITEIADYPAENTDNYVNGNQNVSLYEYTAYMEENEGFNIGEYVTTSLIKGNIDEMIVLDKIYVRTDDGDPYVLKKSKKGRLVKQKVSIENVTDSNYLQITDGLSTSDCIAFPYGDKAREGIKTTDKAPLALF